MEEGSWRIEEKIRLIFYINILICRWCSFQFPFLFFLPFSRFSYSLSLAWVLPFSSYWFYHNTMCHSAWDANTVLWSNMFWLKLLSVSLCFGYVDYMCWISMGFILSFHILLIPQFHSQNAILLLSCNTTYWFVWVHNG